MLRKSCHPASRARQGMAAAALLGLALGWPLAAAQDAARPPAADEASVVEAARKAQAAEREAERSAIAAERERLQQRHTAAQAECYQRFATEDCLRRARGAFRQNDAVLRARELEINDAERKAKAAAREALIEQRLRERPPAGASTPQAAVREPSASEPLAQREQQARERARDQRLRAQAEAQAQQIREQALRAQQARERQAGREAALRERQERQRQRAVEDTAHGHTPAAPLPPPVR